MTTIYILQLEHDKFYVGKTNNLQKRYREHEKGKGEGSEWTSLFKPLKIILQEKVKGDIGIYLEDAYTKLYMQKYSIENVRGGSYCQLELNSERKKLIQKEIWHTQDLCMNCGRHNFSEPCDENKLWPNNKNISKSCNENKNISETCDNNKNISDNKNLLESCNDNKNTSDNKNISESCNENKNISETCNENKNILESRNEENKLLSNNNSESGSEESSPKTTIHKFSPVNIREKNVNNTPKEEKKNDISQEKKYMQKEKIINKKILK